MGTLLRLRREEMMVMIMVMVVVVVVMRVSSLRHGLHCG